jgi:hypothetical protein
MKRLRAARSRKVAARAEVGPERWTTFREVLAPIGS